MPVPRSLMLAVASVQISMSLINRQRTRLTCTAHPGRPLPRWDPSDSKWADPVTLTPAPPPSPERPTQPASIRPPCKPCKPCWRRAMPAYPAPLLPRDQTLKAVQALAEASLDTDLYHYNMCLIISNIIIVIVLIVVMKSFLETRFAIIFLLQ
jgi:hypothetical protein